MDQARFHPLVELLKKVFAHLLGSAPKIDFRRLFLSTSRGQRCPELDRLGVVPARPRHELTDQGNGFWCPMWAWPYVQRAMKEQHLEKVKAGKAQPVRTYHVRMKGPTTEAQGVRWAIDEDL